MLRRSSTGGWGYSRMLSLMTRVLKRSAFMSSYVGTRSPRTVSTSARTRACRRQRCPGHVLWVLAARRGGAARGACRDVRVLGQQVEGPRQHRCVGLVPRDEQRHQVVPQLLGGDLLPLRDEKVQDGGVPHLRRRGAPLSALSLAGAAGARWELRGECGAHVDVLLSELLVLLLHHLA